MRPITPAGSPWKAMEDWKPHRRHGLVVRRTGSVTMLQDRLSDQYHILNETAEFIWKRCDGQHSLEEIERKLRLAFDVPPGMDVGADIRRVLASLKSKHLVEPTEH